jgi:hypothetical protein
MIRPITQADTVLAVYIENEGTISLPTTLILVAWPDGHVVWSGDRLRGGPPYCMSTVDPQTITAALTRAEKILLSEDRFDPRIGHNSREGHSLARSIANPARC